MYWNPIISIKNEIIFADDEFVSVLEWKGENRGGDEIRYGEFLGVGELE